MAKWTSRILVAALAIWAAVTIVRLVAPIFPQEAAGKAYYHSDPEPIITESIVKKPNIRAGKWDRMDRLFTAIRQVESSGGLYLVGDDGRGAGPYCIHRGYWQDACEHLGVDWDYDRYVWDQARCEYIMLAYWDRYSATTDEMRARQHNGGPRGHLKLATLEYWRKVKAILEKP